MKYVALLRGINVGGKNMIKMEALRATFTALGYASVASYINSGNLIFECRSPHISKGVTDISAEAEIAAKIHDAIVKDFGFDISVMVRSMAEIARIISDSPFEGQFENDKDLHVFFLAEELSDEHSEFLLAKNSDAEMISIKGRTIYYLLRISIIDSALGKGFIDKKLKVPATARNWRTINKIIEFS